MDFPLQSCYLPEPILVPVEDYQVEQRGRGREKWDLRDPSIVSFEFHTCYKALHIELGPLKDDLSNAMIELWWQHRRCHCYAETETIEYSLGERLGDVCCEGIRIQTK